METQKTKEIIRDKDGHKYTRVKSTTTRTDPKTGVRKSTGGSPKRRSK